MVCNAVLVSGVQQHASVLRVSIPFQILSRLGYYRALSSLRCAVQGLLVSYRFYTHQCVSVCVNPSLPFSIRASSRLMSEAQSHSHDVPSLLLPRSHSALCSGFRSNHHHSEAVRSSLHNPLHPRQNQPLPKLLAFAHHSAPLTMRPSCPPFIRLLWGRAGLPRINEKA